MKQSAATTIVRAGLLTALVDGLFSSVLSAAFYGSTVARLWKGVASVPFGPKALEGGATYVLIGLLMHLCVAFTWSIVFLAITMAVPFVRRAIATPGGVLAAAVVYGPVVWCTMSLFVIPTFTHRPPTINYRWWVQFFGHMAFVALPIVLMVSRGVSTQER
jgi:hypothetical protein